MSSSAAVFFFLWFLDDACSFSNSDSGGDVVTGVNARLVSAHLFLDDAPRKSHGSLQLTFSCLSSPRFHGARVHRGFFRALTVATEALIHTTWERPKWPGSFFVS
jgi:hypothetical protein